MFKHRYSMSFLCCCHFTNNSVNKINYCALFCSHLDHISGSDAEVIRRIALTQDCMKALDRNIWRSSITTASKIRLYSALQFCTL